MKQTEKASPETLHYLELIQAVRVELKRVHGIENPDAITYKRGWFTLAASEWIRGPLRRKGLEKILLKLRKQPNY